MNFSDFKQLLGADPYSREKQTRAALEQSTEFTAAAVEAEDFERKLEAASQVQAPKDLLVDILAIAKQSQPAPQRVIKNRNGWLMAMAATVFMAVGAGSVLLWQQQQYASIEDYVHKHVGYDGEAALALASGNTTVSPQQINNILGAYASIGPDLIAKIRYIKACPTPNGKGAHFVITTVDGPITVIYMPGALSEPAQQFSVDGQRAHIVPLEQGSIAIIAGSDQAATAVTPFLQSAIQPLSVDT